MTTYGYHFDKRNLCIRFRETAIQLLENAGGIGLSLKVILFESYLQNLEHKAIIDDITFHIILKLYRSSRKFLIQTRGSSLFVYFR